MTRTGLLLLLPITLVAVTGPGAVAQLIPPIETGDISIRTLLVADGLPRTEYTTSTGVSLYFGATDFTPVPGHPDMSVVATHPGKVLALDGSGNLASSLLIDLKSASSPTYSSLFQNSLVLGFTSIAFHPDFANVDSPGYGKFYTLESETKSAPFTPDFANSFVPGDHHDGVLYEYTLGDHLVLECDPDCAASKRQLFRVQQPGYHHNLGDLAFDDNGLLYISSGDGSFTTSTTDPIVSENSALLTNVFGKILRIDPLGNNSENGNYGIPADNPFLDGPGGDVDEIYAYGLRNPFRIEFDNLTGDLYAADVGQLSVESVDLIVAGGNYGWDRKEGSFIYDRYDQENVTVDVDADGNGQGDLAESLGLIDPILEYGHNTGSSIIGGVLYRGSLFPELQGQYVFADYGGKLFHGNPATGEIFEFDYDPSGDELISFIYSLNEDASGELYFVGLILAGVDSESAVMRILRAPASADIDGSGTLECADVDALVQAIVNVNSGGTADLSVFDLTADGSVDITDLDAWLVAAGATLAASGNPLLPGDASLDGEVDGQDFIAWNDAKFTSTPAWCSGDFNADGVVDGRDFIIWNDFKFQSADHHAVPEAGSCALILSVLLLVGCSRRGFA